MMSSDELDLVHLFAKYQKVLDGDESLRETIRETTCQIDQLSREMIILLQIIHSPDGSKKIDDVISKSKQLTEKCKAQYENLSKIVPKNEFFKYHDLWKNSTQKIIFAIALTKFLNSGDLATREYIGQQLSLQVDRNEGFHFTLDDYLHGLLLLASELSRYAVTSATAGNYSVPIQISHFVTELNTGFRLLNFKNDSLRKHYDCLKYDLKKIEEVVYDLSIRSLKPEDPKK